MRACRRFDDLWKTY
ncbi:hypothetical protein [Chryseobacterium sp.]